MLENRVPGPCGTGDPLHVGSMQDGTDVADIPLSMATNASVPLAGVQPDTYDLRVAAGSACGVEAPSNEVVLTVP